MKQIILVIAMLLSIHLTAQTTVKNYCIDGRSCHEQVLKLFTDYTFDYADSVKLPSKFVYVYKNTAGDKIQFFYDMFMRDEAKVYEFRSIACQYANAYRIYTEYFGGTKPSEEIKKYDLLWNYTYQNKKKTLSMSPMDNKGNWLMRF